MSVERIESAITKLETLRAGDMRDWEVDEDEPQEILAMGFEFGTPVVEVRDERHAELIVTLHRTIDAQLEFLGAAVNAANDEDRYFSYRYADALADAILGES